MGPGGRRASIVLLLVLGVAAGVAAFVLRAPRGAAGRPMRLESPQERDLGAGLWVGEARLLAGAQVASLALWGRVNLDAATVRLVDASARRPLTALRPEGTHLLVNGGYFEPNLTPSGLVIGPGLAPNPRSGSRKTSVIALAGGRPFVGPLRDMPARPALALEAWPRLVQDGQPRPMEDPTLARRTAACALPSGHLVLLTVGADGSGGLTLGELAHVLAAPPPKGFGCRAAVNLDGGPSTAFYARGPGVERAHAEQAPVAYGILVTP